MTLTDHKGRKHNHKSVIGTAKAFLRLPDDVSLSFSLLWSSENLITIRTVLKPKTEAPVVVHIPLQTYCNVYRLWNPLSVSFFDVDKFGQVLYRHDHFSDGEYNKTPIREPMEWAKYHVTDTYVRKAVVEHLVSCPDANLTIYGDE